MFARELNQRDWERFDDKWSKARNGCHLWSGETDRNGRGRFSVWRYNERFGSRSAKHLAWERANGRKMRANQVLRATCNNVACINPAHHEIGTRSQVQQAVARDRGFDGETCAHGHVGEYTQVKSGAYKGRRYCRACHRESALDSYYRKKKEAS